MKQKDEMKIIERYRGKMKEEVFGEEVIVKVQDGKGSERKKLKKEIKMMEEEGFERRKGKLKDNEGQNFEIEII